jgi:hypothetical protein
MLGRILLSISLYPIVDVQFNQGSTYWKIPHPTPPGGGKYQPMSFGGKNMKTRRIKRGKCKRKRKKGGEKGRKGKENEKRGSKRFK